MLKIAEKSQEVSALFIIYHTYASWSISDSILNNASDWMLNSLASLVLAAHTEVYSNEDLVIKLLNVYQRLHWRRDYYYSYYGKLSMIAIALTMTFISKTDILNLHVRDLKDSLSIPEFE